MSTKRSRPAVDRTAKTTGGRSESQSTPPREASAWLRATAARRIRQVQAQGLDPHDPDGPLILTTLGRSGGDDEHTCDRCETDCRQGAGRMWSGVVIAGASLQFLVFLCPTCAAREGIPGGDLR